MYESAGLFDRSRLGYLRVATIAPAVRVADVACNVEQIGAGCAKPPGRAWLAVFPELCVPPTPAPTSSTRGSCWRRKRCLAASGAIRQHCRHGVWWGYRSWWRGASTTARRFWPTGTSPASSPSATLPTTGEFYEQRWFTAADRSLPPTVAIGGVQAPFGTDLLFATRYAGLRAGHRNLRGSQGGGATQRAPGAGRCNAAHQPVGQ